MSLTSARPPRLILAALAACCLPPGAIAQNKPASSPATPPSANAQGTPAPPAITPEIKKAITQFQTAAKFQQQRKLPQAIAAYQEFLRLGAQAKMSDSMMLPAYDNLYRLYQARQDAKGMEAMLGHLAIAMPQNPGIQVEYALLYLGQKRFEEAEKSADKALKLKPPPPLGAQAHFARGAVAHTRKQWGMAEKEYAASLSLIPGNPQVLFNLLQAQNEQKKTLPAIKTAEKLVKIAPRMVPAWLLLASLRQQNKDLPGAISAYNGVLKAEPKNRIALFNRALLAQQLMRVDEAISAYAAYLATAPDDFTAHFNLGLLYEGLHNYAGARKHFGAAASLKPKEARVLFQWALSEREAGFAMPPGKQKTDLLAQSVVHFKQAIALDPKNVDMQNQLAALYERDNHFEEAVALFKQRQAQDPDNPEPYQRLTTAFMGMRRIDDAIAEWRKYRSRKPNDPISYGEIATLLESGGKWQEARDERLEQIKLDPKDGFAKLSLAHAYRELKQPDNAASEYRLLLDMDVSAKDVGDKERVYIAAARRNWRVKAWKGLSEVSADAGKYEEAIAYLHNVQEDAIQQAKRDQKPADAQTYLDIASLYERAKQPEPARKELRALTDMRPDDSKAFAALSDFEERQGQTEAAVTALRRAEERDGDPINYGLQIAGLYQKHSLPDKAIAEYARLLEKHPKEARIQEPYAAYLGQAGNDSHALALYDSLLKANPKDIKLLDKKAIVLTRLKRYPESIAVREKIVDAQPEVYQAYADLSNLYTLENRPEAYRQWLGSRVEKDPGNLAAMAALVDAYAQQKLEEDGWKLVRGIVQKHKGDPEVQQAYVNVLLQHKRVEEAIGAQREVAQSRPNDLDTHIKLADMLADSGNPGESNKVFVTMSESADVPLPTRLKARRVLAQRLERQGKLEDAIQQYKAIVKAEPGDMTSTFALGRVLIQAGHDQEAIAYYTEHAGEAKMPAPFRAYYLVRLGSVYEKQGHKDEALRQYREAQRVYPQNDEVGVAIQRLTQVKPDNSKPTGQNAEDKKPVNAASDSVKPTGK